MAANYHFNCLLTYLVSVSSCAVEIQSPSSAEIKDYTLATRTRE